MIAAIVERYQAVFFSSFLAMVAGIVSYINLPRESTPEIRRPLIFVTTSYAGVSASDIETLISKKIEDELDGLEGLDKLTSVSRMHVSSVVAEFNQDTDVETALRRVKERVDIAKAEIPQDAEDPFVRELNFSDQPFFILALANPNGLNVIEGVADYFEEEIKAIPGVLDVRVSGQHTKELLIELNPERLKHYGFAISDVTKAINNEHITIPGGQLRNNLQELGIAVSGELRSVAEFSEITVKAHGRSARLGDLGKVLLTNKPDETIARMNGAPAISFSVTKRSGENLIEITDTIKALVEEKKSHLPHGTIVSYSFDSSQHIRDMIYDLENNILTSFLMVVGITLFFLGPVNALFISIGIPFSMFLSFIALSYFDITLNMVVLFSLVLALGMLVDNGIVIVENIYRHRSLGKERVAAAISGTNEVALPIIASTVTTALAFFPIIFMPGIMGEFMGYLPKTVIIVLLSSLLVALTITPVFCSRYLNVSRKSLESMSGSSSKGFALLVARYIKVLEYCLKRPIRTIVATFTFVFAGIILYATLGKAPIFFPNLDPDAATISIDTAPGNSLNATAEITQAVSGLIQDVPASLDNTQVTVGRSKGGDFSGGSLDASKANIRLGFAPYGHREISAFSTIDAIKERLSNFTAAKIKVQQMEGGPPQGHAISYEIRGDAYPVIGSLAEEVKKIINLHENAFMDVDYDYEQGKPEITVSIDREKATKLGLNTAIVARTLRSAINGGLAGKYREGKEEYDITIRYPDTYRNTIDQLKSLSIVEGNIRVPLTSIATIGTEAAVNVIKRNDRRRAVNVWADFKEGFDDRQKVELIKSDIATKVAAIPMPTNYRIVDGQGAKERDESTAFLLRAFGVALGLIFLVLVIQFNSMTQPFIIMISVFLSLGGVFWGLFLSGMTFGIIMSGIGVISLAGVVVNNAIVMIDFFNGLVKSGVPVSQAIVQAGETRLRPVLLTALTTVIGLIPMGFAISLNFHNLSIEFGSQSAQMFKAMAWALIYGLSLATVLTLVILPVFLLLDDRLSRFVKRRFG